MHNFLLCRCFCFAHSRQQNKHQPIKNLWNRERGQKHIHNQQLHPLFKCFSIVSCQPCLPATARLNYMHPFNAMGSLYFGTLNFFLWCCYVFFIYVDYFKQQQQRKNKHKNCWVDAIMRFDFLRDHSKMGKNFCYDKTCAFITHLMCLHLVCSNRYFQCE